MEHSVSYWMGVVVGISLVVILGATCFLIRRKKVGKSEYDERQQLIRGTAFKYGYFTSIIYFLLFTFFQDFTAERYIKSTTGMFLGVCISVFVWSSYSILYDGYFSMKENPRTYVLIFGGVGIFNLFFGIKFYFGETLEGVNGVMNLCAGTLFGCLLIVMSIKRIRDKKEQE